MLASRFIRQLLRTPFTWLAVIVAGAGVWQFARHFQPPLPMLGAAVVVAAVLLGLWPLLLARDARFMSRLVRPASELKAGNEARLRTLEAQLRRLDAEQPLKQLELLRSKLDKLTTVLQYRLDAGELTYGRYLGASEQVYLAALDNLHEVVLILESRSAGDEDYVARRIREIELDGVSEREQAEHASLVSRRELADAQLRKMEVWLAENERAMAVLDNTVAALTDTRTREGMARLSADDAIRELEELAARTGRYAARR